MKTLKSKLFLMVVIIVTLMPNSVFALNESLYNKYWNNDIYFYDPDAGEKDDEEPPNCEKPGDNGGNNGGGGGNSQWDGHCSNINSYSGKISEFYDVIHSVAEKNGLPWEGIVAQLIGESSFMANEVCPYNPLGLKGEPSCDSRGHRTFSSYDEAFNYYVNSIKPVREAMGKFKNDPYGYVDFLINGVPGYKYATDPNYINKISGFVCGVQEWAKANNKPISGSGGGGGSSDDGSSDDGGSSSDLPYCEDDDDDDNNCEEDGTCDDYVFPLQGATKSNYLNGNSLSPLPCNNMSQGGCHHDYYAMDLGLSTGTKNESDYPDLAGKYTDYYWKSTGVKVVAMTSGKITSYKTYGKATNGYTSKCASVTYETNDGRKFWLGHMLYDSKYKAGDTFGTGDVIGEVGPPPCAIGMQAHLHVDETPTYGSNGSVKTVELLNTLYEQLP